MNPLDVIIPAVIFGYVVYLIVRMIKNRKRGCSCGGCAGCPMADGCRVVHEQENRKDMKKHEP